MGGHSCEYGALGSAEAEVRRVDRHRRGTVRIRLDGQSDQPADRRQDGGPLHAGIESLARERVCCSSAIHLSVERTVQLIVCGAQARVHRAFANL